MARKTVYIVGAGFSYYAGLPLQAGFTEALLEPRSDEEYPLRPLLKHLGTFVHDVFGHGESAKALFWPNLEDVFTNIDMAANTGHHLGKTHSPSRLRTTRRVLLARMMCMLHERLKKAEREKNTDWSKLDKLFKSVDPAALGFISMNWDTVIERRLKAIGRDEGIDYKCGAVAALFPKENRSRIVVRKPAAHADVTIPLVKMHGSVNWLYCDNCRQLYWFDPVDAMAVAMQLITKREGKQVGLTDTEHCEKWRCAKCHTVPLTTRIATFSFLKALDFPMFERSWLAAETLLRQAKKWVFIGYSLPAADFEFKHLLKRVQLSRKVEPEFVIITGGSEAATEIAYRNYQGFFGRAIKRQENFFAEGLTAEAIAAAHEEPRAR